MFLSEVFTQKNKWHWVKFLRRKINDIKELKARHFIDQSDLLANDTPPTGQNLTLYCCMGVYSVFKQPFLIVPYEWFPTERSHKYSKYQPSVWDLFQRRIWHKSTVLIFHLSDCTLLNLESTTTKYLATQVFLLLINLSLARLTMLR